MEKSTRAVFVLCESCHGQGEIRRGTFWETCSECKGLRVTRPAPHKAYPVDDITGWLDEPPLVTAEEPIPAIKEQRMTDKQTKPAEPTDTSVTFRNITETLNRFDDLPGTFSTYYRSIVDPESLYVCVSELRHRSSLPATNKNHIDGDRLRKVAAEMVMELDRLMQAHGSDLGDVVSAHVYGISQMAAEDLQKFLSLPGADAAIDRMIQAREARRKMQESEIEKGMD